MTTSDLTRRQRELINEIDRLIVLLDLDHRDLSSMDKDQRTFHLHSVKTRIIRAEIIELHRIIELALEEVISAHFFGKRRTDTVNGRSIPRSQ